MLQLQTVIGRASVYRKESYRSGTSAKVEWIVKYLRSGEQEPIVVRDCKTRKEATQFAWIYKD